MQCRVRDGFNWYKDAFDVNIRDTKGLESVIGD